ncbi:hypothetical protein EV178_005255 [Coemansia sp. RSA 1646]|nr:hypothetical protein EV178_005255 [Coemansia sp. RSA 1646]
MSEITLKQIYGMLCWLRAHPNNSKLWSEDRKRACERAIAECPHLKDADAMTLESKFAELEERRCEIIDQFDGTADKVPRDTRLFEGGPLFSIVDHALAGEQQRQPENSLLERARRLSPAEIDQMRDEMVIRRQIAMRDAILLADWIAMRRRELELQEAKIRELIRNQQHHGLHNDSIHELRSFEEIIRHFHMS